MKEARACTAGIVLLAGASVWADVLHVPERYPNIQTAINFAVDGDEIVIADGVYTGPSNKNLDCLGLAITIRSKNGPETCIIDCEGDGRAFRFFRGEAADTVISEITLRGGNPGQSGGAIVLQGSYPTIEFCVFKENQGANGGAIYVGGPAVISKCCFERNVADGIGGAIEIDTTAIIADCSFIENTSAGAGGALAASNGSPRIERCVFTENSAASAGGCLLGSAASGTLANCLFHDNTATYASAVSANSAGWTLRNNTITANTSSSGRGAIHFSASAMMFNCIVYGNSDEEIVVDNGSPSITYCLVEGNWAGSHNIDADPLFVIGPKGGFYLSNTKTGHDAKSPCINAGYGNAVDYGLNKLTNRIDGKTDRKTADMGYHYPKR